MTFLNLFKINHRLYFIIALLLLAFILSGFFVLNGTSSVKTASLEKIDQIIMETQKAKLRSLTHVTAAALARGMAGMEKEEDRIA